MISLTQEEVLAMNGLLDSEAIEGIVLQASKESEEKRLEKVEKSLTEKEFLIDGKFSDKFMVTTKLLEDYKTSEHKVFINTLRIGLQEEEYGIVLELQQNKEISFSRVPRITIVKKYIESTPFLRKEQKKSFFAYEKQPFTNEEYENDLDRKEWKYVMVIQTYVKQRMKLFCTYYFDDEEAYCYDHIKKTRQQRGAKDFRTDLLTILEIGKKNDG